MRPYKFKFGDFYFVKSTSTGSRIHGISSNLSFINKKRNKGESVYVLKCWNETEEFYKVGITMNSIGRRFSTEALMPYNFSIMYEHLCSTDVALLLEETIRDQYTSYIPKMKFGGHTECFIPDDEIIRHIEISLKSAYPVKPECDYFDKIYDNING